MTLLVLAGDDRYSIGGAIAEVTRTGGFDALDVERMDAVSVPRQSVLMTVGTAGLFASHRMVVIEGMGLEKKSTSRAKGKNSDDQVLTLEDLLAAVPVTTTAVVVLTGVRSDSRVMKEAAKLRKEARIQMRMFAAPKPKDMPGWLQRVAKETGIRLEPRAAQQLAHRVGGQVGIGAIELQKLSTAAGPDGTVTEKLVESLVPQTSEESIFPLIDAIAAKQAKRALQLLSTQLEQIHGNEAELSLPLIRLLARQMRLLLYVQLLGAEGSKREDIVGALKLPEYYADRYFSQAAKLSRAQLGQAIERLAATEQQLKNGEAGPAALQLLVTDLTMSSKRAET